MNTPKKQDWRIKIPNGYVHSIVVEVGNQTHESYLLNRIRDEAKQAELVHGQLTIEVIDWNWD